jgi:hypothetical protein
MHWFMLGIVVAMTLLGSLVFAAPSSNSTICFVVIGGILFVGRHLDQVATSMHEPLRTIVNALYFAIPHLEFYDLRDLIIHNWPLIEWKYIVLALLYATAYIGFSARRMSGVPPQAGELKHEFAADIFLLLLALLVFCFGLAAQLSPQFQSWRGSRSGGDIFNVVLGDSRRMFAQSFYVKADAYYHSGYYPTMFDNKEAFQTQHMAEDTGAVNSNNHGDEEGFLGPKRNWIDALAGIFSPTATRIWMKAARRMI